MQLAMELKFHFVALACFLLLSCCTTEARDTKRRSHGTVSPVDGRIAVIANNWMSTGHGYLAFSTDFTAGKLRMSTSSDGHEWSNWVVMATSVSVTSNPVACTDNRTGDVQVFVQGTDGQVYMYRQTGTTTFTETKLSTDIPTSLPPSQFSLDAVKCVILKKATHIFARSQINESRLYWSYENGSDWSKWVAIGDDSTHLAYDAFISINTFVNRLAIFGVFLDGKLRHTWQTSDTGFDDKWHEIGLFQKTFTSAPVAHQMGPSDFNGMLQVFARGDDGTMYTIRQTTCDRVTNPWGPCTWELYYRDLGGTIPADKTSKNPLSISNNIHLGIEVFTVGASNKHLYHIWQLERDASWSSWEDIGALSPTSGFESQPCVVLGDYGWWQAFALNSTGGVSTFVQSPLKFTLSTDSVAFNRNVTVSWAIPKDEATNKDWIGVYPTGAENHKYVDFAYVGGTQNPLKDPVPVGELNLTAVLPNGKYDYRYLVNKEYNSVLSSSATVYNGTTDPEWVQVYKGLARGLGSINENVTLCVEDGNRTVETFREAFDAFENRKIFDGLHLLAEGLEDLRDALVQCNETEIVEDLTKFIEDLISCTEDACSKFLIDLGIELIILYEHIYEIYGDIRAATNCFDIDAYEQGGICIGRVTNACMTLE